MILVYREKLDLEGFQVCLDYLDLVACLDPRETEDHRETQVDLVWVRRDLLDLKDLMDFLDLQVWENQDLRDSVVLLANKVRKCLIVFAACSVGVCMTCFRNPRTSRSKRFARTIRNL